ncbi:polysaccharide lyase family 7 protein [Simiduia agarivorans]|uniref:Cyclic nucleotide-binding domain-containing protein n=1 Tax=Simiduia agarivorans (strain DSM 21679 / JCM 13881 / BCRC 17597 / SA1) TaxID=1117647 RepID=K4KJF4_SIMAS|nr:polysaccharide lyase family 7 protein [Simiduia agarivorans]AFU99264.1 cyclic nucleotide-binding domain-containing protein [Simiduia agarivorans SA1 = DSM 21679]
MRKTLGLAALLLSSELCANELVNPGFEQGWEGWQPQGEGLSISDKAYTGKHSVKLTKPGSYVGRLVSVTPDTRYQLTARVLGAGTLGVKVDGQMYFDQPERKTRDWEELSVVFDSQGATQAIVFASYAGTEGRFDDFSFSLAEHAGAPLAAAIQPKSEGGTGLSPDLPPGRNFDLLGWYLSTPRDDDGDGIGDIYYEWELANGFEDELYFFTRWDGGMTFRAPNKGGRTSANTKFTRSELRGMLRRGDKSIKTKATGGPNKNNWVFSSAPPRAQRIAGAVDGRMEATLAVNYVTVTGAPNQVGRVIIGQIHADKDEPIRLYYRKLPNNTRGSVYMAHEPSRGHGDEIFIDLIGSRKDNAEDPANGIALDEKFSYVIDAKGNSLRVEIYVGDELRGQTEVDMSQSGYDVSDDYMYFKAGVYNQNNTGNADDFVQATFYRLETSHGTAQP